MSMVCSLNGDGSQATNSTNTNANTNANTATNSNSNTNAIGSTATHTTFDYTQQQQQQQQQQQHDMPNASTPLLLGHESGGLSGVANSDVGNNGSGAAITVLQPPVILGTANFTATEPAAASASDTVVSMNSGTLNVSGVTLPGTLNFVMGATSAQAATNNDNNNNMDNASDDSNPVTIYRCRAPIASLDCMEEFSGTGGHLDFGRSISLGSNPALPLRHGSTPTPGLRYKNLGKSGLRISNVGLGTWPVFSPGVSDEQAEAILKLAIDSGINLFDISEAHSETEIGKILQRTGWKRTTYVITTKVYWSTKSEERGLSRKHIIECVRASLQRLQLNYIDIVIIHKADPMCPMEVVRAMSYVIQQGWAMYWGTARWSQVEIMEAYTNCRQFNCITPIVEQSEYHMFCREKCELYLPEMYNKIGVGLMAWGPLSMALSDTQNGDKLFLPKGSFKTKSFSWTEDEINRNAALSPQGSWGKDRIEEGRRHCDRLRDLAALAEKLGCSPTQLSIAWSLKHEPVQCLLLGATSAEQLHQSLQSLQLLPRLSSSVMLELERILENKPVRPPMISTLALR
ncbi:voltage-gated potassium channel subunit beta-2-like isoform X2 [Drosophila novamexicana]|uniref:voltage-gated potassium channel subunit beta-2-like isoform X2 n=1 Tax=Drosophila novamexicana TaxID=47314 RepID=UPI0011E5FD4E|nr:voltage-gated potassium channel subunit beta-2-like isoform X2 [Drosophila novamexicana]